ncbi:uncharacterized protein M6B38_163930 [Iris pallida]|uniref:Uncharacterized protein n=1 Tax=Iris pallida TaxID=29817 RepID=A0AAX6EXS7_IRIPA|nr:uncharacterized protein M6B38_163930 [Iris pallida]
MGHHLNRVTPQNQNTGERGQTQPATYIEIEYISTIRSRLSRYEGLLQASSLLRSSLLSQSSAINRVTRCLEHQIYKYKASQILHIG